MEKRTMEGIYLKFPTLFTRKPEIIGKVIGEPIENYGYSDYETILPTPARPVLIRLIQLN
jgi:hypothetical protein